MKHSKASLFLMEMILVLLFFSLASCICVQLFVKSNLLSNKTKELTCAVGLAQNAAEAFYGTDGDIQQMASLFPGSIASSEDASLTIYKDGYVCTVAVSDSSDGFFLIGDIYVSAVNEMTKNVYSLSVKKYIATGGASHGHK